MSHLCLQVKILEHLGRHAGIARLFALSSDPSAGPAKDVMIMEYAHLGSLDNVLANACENAGDGYPPTSDAVLLTAALQVAEAMKHLAVNGVIHRDLATRNVLAFTFSRNQTKDVEVKLTDFGLSSAVGISEGDEGTAPERWMAPETLSANPQFSEMSDVWSFGVLMWELWALRAGATGRPYDHVDDDNEVKDGILGGTLSLEVPQCPKLAADIVEACCLSDVTKRLDFKALCPELQEALYQVRSAQDLDEDENNCCICMDNKRNILVQPCMHLCICNVCQSGLPNNECPLCRGPITSLTKVHL
jgi:serine/threonine protein kinase